MKTFRVSAYSFQMEPRLADISTFGDDLAIVARPATFSLDEYIYTEEQAIELVKKFFAATRGEGQ